MSTTMPHVSQFFPNTGQAKQLHDRLGAGVTEKIIETPRRFLSVVLV